MSRQLFPWKQTGICWTPPLLLRVSALKPHSAYRPTDRQAVDRQTDS